MIYRNLSEYFREKYGQRLKKICIDGGFSCPNRDGTCGRGGCIYCGERGAGEHIDAKSSITEQVTSALSKAESDRLFIAYFQNFTNTYAPADTLRERYDAALIDPRIKVLAIGTRPDCINEEVCQLIAEYKSRVDVWVELGLQSASDKTADVINRGYYRDCFERAMKCLSDHGIPVVVHLIVGLPNEDMEDIKNTTEYINRFDLFGIKIHSIYVMKDTRLAEMYKQGEYTPPTLDFYLEAVCYILSHVSPDLVIHRLTGDCPKDMLIAPNWNLDKHNNIRMAVELLESRGLCQGSLYRSQNKN